MLYAYTLIPYTLCYRYVNNATYSRLRATTTIAVRLILYLPTPNNIHLPRY